MPKQKQGKIKHKTRGAVKKRFKVTKTGKVMSASLAAATCTRPTTAKPAATCAAS